MTKKQKVVVYAVENDKLLVFRHVDFSYEEVGIQVPAGSVREGESFTDAALRELKEETGFDCFEIVSEIGADTYDMSPYRAELQERHFFLAKPTAELPERWGSQEDHDGEQEPTRFECFWIPLAQAHVLQSAQSIFVGSVSQILSSEMEK